MSEEDPLSSPAPSIEHLRRLETGIPRLDTIVSGGLHRGGTYLVCGAPGSGKTIFANQLCFGQARHGDSAVYMTFLAENHARMLQHLQPFSFFRREEVGNHVHYVSGFSVLEKGGFAAVRQLVHQLMTKYEPSVLVIDGAQAFRGFASSEIGFQRFLRELQTVGTMAGSTLLILVPDTSDYAGGMALVDGVLELTMRDFGPRTVRELTARKFRGGPSLMGRHEVEIGKDGVVIHPRTEIAFSAPSEIAEEDRQRTAFGIPPLDEMFEGGVLSGSTTLILGAPGTGKTVLGLHYLAEGARRGEPGVYFGFYETPPRLMEKADSLGIDLRKSLDAGRLEIQWQPPLETNLDALAERLLERIRHRDVKRLRVFIDGMAGFRDAAIYPDRLKRFFAALTHQLRELDVTTVVSEETRLFGNSVELPNEEFAAVAENVVYLRYVEKEAALHRLLVILKARESAYDSRVREFFIRPSGIELADSFESAEDILRGTPRTRSAT